MTVTPLEMVVGLFAPMALGVLAGYGFSQGPWWLAVPAIVWVATFVVLWSVASAQVVETKKPDYRIR